MQNKGGREIGGQFRQCLLPQKTPTMYLVWCPLGIIILGSLANRVNLTFVSFIRYMAAVIADHSRYWHEIGKMKSSIMYSCEKWVLIVTASYEYFWLILETG